VRLVVTDVRMTLAPKADAERGLFAFVSCTYGDLRLDGLTLRRTRGGPLTVSFPARKDGAGREHPFLRPLTSAARHRIEAQVFAALGLAEVAS